MLFHVTGFTLYLLLAVSGYWLAINRRWMTGSLLIGTGIAVLLFTPTGS